MMHSSFPGESVRRPLARRFAFVLLTVITACAGPSGGPSPEVGPAAQRVRTGAEMLAATDYALLAGKRIGLIANATSRVDSAHLVDLLHAAPGVTIAALFGPEHGIRGDADAGEAVDDAIDTRTGAPIYSLYGASRKPSPEQLAGLDVLVFDIQDVGARFYTYISTLGLAMEAAAEAGLPFVVLDRPNPLGGDVVEGFLMEPEHTSFVGAFPIPVTHGLTVGELARMIQGEGWVDGVDELVLHVVPMEGWRRSMRWEATGLPWIPTSPNIPDPVTALVYPGTCFFEGVEGSEGRGTTEPFQVVGALWADGRRMAENLQARDLPGLRFEPAQFTPVSIPGMATHPRFEGQLLQGVRLHVTDPVALRPVAAGVHLLEAFYQAAPESERGAFLKSDWLAKLGGTHRLRQMLLDGVPAASIITAWSAETAAFDALRAAYLLYE